MISRPISALLIQYFPLTLMPLFSNLKPGGAYINRWTLKVY